MVRMSCTVMRLGCLRLGMSSPDLVQDRENAVTVQTMTNRVQGLPKLSGNYRNPCPGFTETRVRELLKSVSGNLRNPQMSDECGCSCIIASLYGTCRSIKKYLCA